MAAEEDNSISHILLIVGFLTVLFLFKDYASSKSIPEFHIWGFTLNFGTVWLADVVTFAITLFMFALASIGLLWRWTTLAGYVFYVIAVLIIPAFFAAYILTEHAEVVRLIGSILALGLAITLVIMVSRRAS